VSLFLLEALPAPLEEAVDARLGQKKKKGLRLPYNLQFFNFGNGFRRIQMLGARLGAVHNGMTPIKLEGIIELIKALPSRLVP